MGSKTRLSSYCSNRGDDTVNLITSRKTNARLAHPISCSMIHPSETALYIKGNCYKDSHHINLKYESEVSLLHVSWLDILSP